MNQDPFSEHVNEVRLPNLGGTGESITFGQWLVSLDSKVIAGERIAEIHLPGTLFFLEAQEEGTLIQQFVKTGDPLVAEQIVCRIQRH
ncbi:biotin/lipoyl-containing protein [Planctomicrobium sp. SH668]|uniref:biotin/lipoyl-containing protein n=1 Tax=Planctomicrobium sp. SH668 TaxID=3448126 RepID=UPI003F5BFEE3